MKKRFNIMQVIFALLGGLVLLFIIAPLAGLLLSSSPVQLFDTWQEKEVTNSIRLTLLAALSGTLFFSMAAIPFSWLMARRHFPLKRLIAGIIDLPIVIPHSAAGIAILGFISRDSLLGSAASKIGINFIGHPIGIAVAMAFVSIPFLINASINGFLSVPERLEKAALNLGASPARVFFTISLPLAWRNILSGIVLMFARGMSEFGAVVIVAYHPMVTPVLIWERFGAYGLNYAQPVAVIFILITLFIFILLRSLSKEPKNR